MIDLNSQFIIIIFFYYFIVTFVVYIIYSDFTSVNHTNFYFSDSEEETPEEEIQMNDTVFI